jgi:hypothetical protein
LTPEMQAVAIGALRQLHEQKQPFIRLQVIEHQQWRDDRVSLF